MKRSWINTYQILWVINNNWQTVVSTKCWKDLSLTCIDKKLFVFFFNRFSFGGRGRPISCQPLRLRLNSPSPCQLDAGEQHRGSTNSSIFYLAANNPGRQQPRLGPSSRTGKVLQWEREGRRELEQWGNGEKEVEKQEEMQRGRRVCVCVYMQAYVRRRREGEERKGQGEGE